MHTLLALFGLGHWGLDERGHHAGALRYLSLITDHEVTIFCELVNTLGLLLRGQYTKLASKVFRLCEATLALGLDLSRLHGHQSLGQLIGLCGSSLLLS